MSDKTSKKNAKRLPKGQRTHIRRLKQAARKEGNLTNPQASRGKAVRAPKKQDGS
jgi:hypothetical protein